MTVQSNRVIIASYAKHGYAKEILGIISGEHERTLN